MTLCCIFTAYRGDSQATRSQRGTDVLVAVFGLVEVSSAWLTQFQLVCRRGPWMNVITKRWNFPCVPNYLKLRLATPNTRPIYHTTFRETLTNYMPFLHLLNTLHNLHSFFNSIFSCDTRNHFNREYHITWHAARDLLWFRPRDRVRRGLYIQRNHEALNRVVTNYIEQGRPGKRVPLCQTGN